MDFFTIFVNWFSEMGEELPATSLDEGGKDIFSRFMNKISG